MRALLAADRNEFHARSRMSEAQRKALWALRENLELPIDAFDAPRFHLARFRGSSSGLSP